MSPATAAMIIQGVAALAPYLSQLGELAMKARNGEVVTADDLARAENARKLAFTALRQKLTPQPGNSIETSSEHRP
ncbi:hypothetical protein [Dongia sp.]|uniref:hypothetical protein n=1 Tax=Dongia sp. TaxID=1977262 RepID=UPI0035AF4671